MFIRVGIGIISTYVTGLILTRNVQIGNSSYRYNMLHVYVERASTTIHHFCIGNKIVFPAL